MQARLIEMVRANMPTESTKRDNTLGEMMVRLPYRPTLSEALKAGILAMVAAASGTKRCQMEAGGLVPLMGRGAQRFDSIRQAAGI